MRTGSTIGPNNCGEREVLASQEGVLKELERHGYVADPQPADSAGGMICRHPAAPNLRICDDGRLELLSGHPDAQGLRWQPVAKRIHWDRALIILTLLCATTFLGLLVVALIVE